MQYLSVLFFISVLIGCSNETTKTNIESDSTITSVDQPMNNPLDTMKIDTVPLKETIDTSIKGLLVGTHPLTLQWISWDKPGYVHIKPATGDWYPIEGEQKSATGNNYVRIEGKIKPVSEKELLFEGRIETLVESINGGKPCLKKGEQIFLSTKGRKYWRMQNMLNCEGNRVTDYVDIYFKKI
jgi:hypothetical protein